MNIQLINPIGYCAGVNSAINKAIEIKEKYTNRNVYVFGMIVHNEDTCNYLASLGIITIETDNIDIENRLNLFKDDEIVIFPSHGHNPKYDEILKKNNVTFFDVVCPKVKKNNEIILKETNLGRQIIYIGNKNHAEAKASLSISPNCLLYDINDKMDYSLVKTKNIKVINQTTLSFIELVSIHEDLLNHFNDLDILNEICNATRLRQKSLSDIDYKVDKCLILGSTKSSNTTKLEIIARSNKNIECVYKISKLEELKNIKFSKNDNIVIASGTSTSMDFINKVKNYLVEVENG